MKIKLQQILSLSLLIFILWLISYESYSQHLNEDNQNQGISKLIDENKLASEFLLKLKNEKVDTIIFFQRTCINCCDFFNIFWTKNSEIKLQKIYFDVNYRKTISKSINLSNDSIFTELNKYYSSLKAQTIKYSMHILSDSTLVTTSHYYHYCFSEISIYTQNDSIISARMKDHDFEKTIRKGYGNDQIIVPNDNYLTNLNSSWYILLTKIVNTIANMPEISNREFESLRRNKINE